MFHNMFEINVCFSYFELLIMLQNIVQLRKPVVTLVIH